MAPSDRSSRPTPLLDTGRLRIGAWLLSALAFVAGAIIGMTLNAQIGMGLWIACAVLAFIPFLSHRNNT